MLHGNRPDFMEPPPPHPTPGLASTCFRAWTWAAKVPRGLSLGLPEQLKHSWKGTAAALTPIQMALCQGIALALLVPPDDHWLCASASWHAILHLHCAPEGGEW